MLVTMFTVMCISGLILDRFCTVTTVVHVYTCRGFPLSMLDLFTSVLRVT